MGNCCRSPAAVAREDVKSAYDHPRGGGAGANSNGGEAGVQKRVTVLRDGNYGKSKAGIDEKYLLDRELGRGEFGVTYLCMDRDTRELLACKSISKRKLRTAVDVEDVRREVAIMRHLPKSPSIVTLREACEDDQAVHLVMELCEGGELFDRIVARGHYTERAAASVTRTIMEVVQLCHRHGVIHRDLKPENFLFANKKENSPLKAIDFGLSIFFNPGERFSEIVGSPYYMAPEVLKRNYGPEIDIWSAGVILYILLCGVPPFWSESEQGVAQAILRGSIDFKRDPWPSISENAKNLVRQMLEPEPKLRLTAKQKRRRNGGASSHLLPSFPPPLFFLLPFLHCSVPHHPGIRATFDPPSIFSDHLFLTLFVSVSFFAGEDPPLIPHYFFLPAALSLTPALLPPSRGLVPISPSLPIAGTAPPCRNPSPEAPLRKPPTPLHTTFYPPCFAFPATPSSPSLLSPSSLLSLATLRKPLRPNPHRRTRQKNKKKKREETPPEAPRSAADPIVPAAGSAFLAAGSASVAEPLPSPGSTSVVVGSRRECRSSGCLRRLRLRQPPPSVAAPPAAAPAAFPLPPFPCLPARREEGIRGEASELGSGRFDPAR
ncbi:hypothetical protein Taro_019654 [Colocasia esculenta]|uniref:non-specific serine/threonine protein kinase n=1 Tax=Colocasia esculenta TaxID=4460 RepID=A0A843ULL5_COLES|nr:hypothetical protein [Colocasia esculenta]